MTTAFGRFRAAAPVPALLASACCLYGVWSVAITGAEGYDDPGGANPPAAYMAGDTVRFLAREALYEATCDDPAAPSDRDPGAYAWSVSDAAVAQLLGPGRVWFVRTGAFQVTVATGHARDRLDGIVVPRVAAVRVSPRDTTIDAGDTLSYLVEGLDSTGAIVTAIGRANGTVRLDQDPADFADPIAANQAGGDGVRFLYRGYRPGVVTLIARLPIYGAQHLADTVRLTVR